MTERDLETVSLLAQMAALETTWRKDAAETRAAARSTRHQDGDYREGYADALDRCVQALRALGEQW